MPVASKLVQAGRTSPFWGCLLLLAGCATQPTGDGAKVRVVSDAQRDRCQFIQMVKGSRSLGPDKLGNALQEALNAAAAAGGNGLYVVTQGIHAFDGASVSGEALRCPS